MTPTVLLATCADLAVDDDEDAGVLAAALARVGVEGQLAVWTDPTVDWTAGLVVLRSTWDYTDDVDRFRGWVSGLPRVANDASVVRWNTDKSYLRELAEAAVPVVPTTFAGPGEEVALPDRGEYVIKPAVGAGSRGAGLFGPDQHDDARRHAAALHAAGRTVLVQPYLDAVGPAGETALVYVDGRFSHAIRKGALLTRGRAQPIDAECLFSAEAIEPRSPSEAELAVGDAALAFLRERFGGDLLYTRVDLLPGADGPVVVELELTEPSLFLRHSLEPDPDAPADRFAAAIAARA